MDYYRVKITIKILIYYSINYKDSISNSHIRLYPVQSKELGATVTINYADSKRMNFSVKRIRTR